MASHDCGAAARLCSPVLPASASQVAAIRSLLPDDLKDALASFDAAKADLTACMETQAEGMLNASRSSWYDHGGGDVRALYLSAPFLCNGGKSRLCVLDRHYAGTA